MPWAGPLGASEEAGEVCDQTGSNKGSGIKQAATEDSALMPAIVHLSPFGSWPWTVAMATKK